MIPEVQAYFDALKKKEQVRNSGCASFKDIAVAIDRADLTEREAIIALGKIELTKILNSNIFEEDDHVWG